MILESVIDHEHNLNHDDLCAGGDDAPIEPVVERSFSHEDNNGNDESLKDGDDSSFIAQQIDDAWENDSQKSIVVESSDTSSVEILQVR